ncbi:MAG: RIP metalloprotease RseP [Ignavibacteriaceae bacterium]|nr:RIP metalloprotease RseP [Ignavibacteriaceae bacterium]
MSEVIYFIITIAILVFVHEFGHFAAAKLSGMRVDAFAIGFGYRLFGFNKKTGFSFGELPKNFQGDGFTDYRLCLLPLGGYVKIAGMIDESLDTKFVASEPQPYEFRSKSTIKKVFVITAGVLMNFLLALGIFWGNNYFTGKQYSLTTTVGYIEAGSKADSAGFRVNDKILEINGKKVTYWEDIKTSIFVANMGLDLNVKLLRDGQEMNLKVPRNLLPPDESRGLFLVSENIRPLIQDVLGNTRADSAGVKPGDVLLAINSTPVFSTQQTISTISGYKETPIDISLLRAQDTVSLAITPNKEGKIGIMLGGYAYLGPTERVTYGILTSLYYGFTDAANMAGLTFVMIKRVITGDVEFGKAFGGPIKIAQFAAKSADSGLSTFIMFLGLLSLSLALLNILPFPVLDGGHLVMILIEAIMKREIPVKVKIAIQNAGFVLLLLLMVFILYHDFLGL